VTISTSKRGAKSELLACVWLINQGYEVFRGVHPDGLADIAAYRAGIFTLIDVKTLTIPKRSQPFHKALSADQVAKGVRLLTVHPETGLCVLHPPGVAKSCTSARDRRAAAIKGAATRMLRAAATISGERLH
jgi:hypothetical protein